MDWMVIIGNSCLETLASLSALAIVFTVLVHFTPCNRGMYWWKDLGAAGTDLLYWFLMPLLMRAGRTILLTLGIAFLFGGSVPGFSKVSNQSLWGQCLAILLIQDVLLYWIHRLFHTRLGWRIHSIHHSPRVLDWLSASRFHVVNDLVAFVIADVVVLLLGFPPAALLVLAPFNIFYSSMVHANLNWTFGPFRHLFASPVFHRWHHTVEAEGKDKNFAPTFPILDVIFGTFYMPTGKLPQQFGNGEQDFPEDFWGQLVHPFRQKPQSSLPVPLGVPPAGRKAA
jgi:sterol desaturase/sphingolipid hydroxylase (fatty acid hydroxylase superfamily)